MSETWETAVAKILAERKKIMSVQEICSAMKNHPLVKPHHNELWGGQPNLDHLVRSTLAKLKRKGVIRRVGHGLYISNRDTT